MYWIWFLIASLEGVFIIENPESGHERPVDLVQFDVESSEVLNTVNYGKEAAN